MISKFRPCWHPKFAGDIRVLIVVRLAVVIADPECAGFALFFTNYSTFLGKPGLYLEDVFVKPHLRRKGIGLALLKKLAAIARERDYGRMEWSVLDWNEPAIHFYKKLGAVPLDDWRLFRLTGEALANFG